MNSPDGWTVSSLVEELHQLGDARRWYLSHPHHFALGDPEGRYDAILGPTVLERAAQRPVVAFTKKQEAYLSDFCNVALPRVMGRMGRSCSKTFCAAISLADLAWCLPSFTATVSAGSEKQASRMYRYWKAFALSPEMRYPRGPLMEDPRATEAVFRNGGFVTVLSASERSVQGEHPMMTVLDEAMATDEAIMSLLEGQVSGSPPPWGAREALYRIQSTGTKTHHLFRERYEAAERGELKGYVLHTWGQRACPWITEEEIARAIAEHSENWVNIHIEGRWGSASGTVWKESDILAAAVRRLQDDEVWRYAEERPDAITAKVLGQDWGYVNLTCNLVLARVDPGKGTREAMFPDVPAWPRYYVVHVEGNAGDKMGADYLYERAVLAMDTHRCNGYGDVSHKFPNDHLRQRARAIGLRWHEVVSSGNNQTMIDRITAWLEHRQLIIPQEIGTRRSPAEGQKLLDQMLAYAWAETGGRERPQKGNDDYVDALKFAGHGMGQYRSSRVISIPR